MSNYNESKHNQNPHRFKVVFLIVILLGLGGYIAVWLLFNSGSNGDEYGFLDGQRIGFVPRYVFIDGELYSPIFVEDELYLPINLVQNYVDEHLYWDGNYRVSITTRTHVFRIDVGQTAHTVNGRTAQLDLPVIMASGTPHLPANFIAELNDVAFEFRQDINTLIITNNAVEPTLLRVTRDGEPLRYEPGSRSPAQTTLYSQDTVVLINSSDGFCFVKTEGGLTGHVVSGRLEVAYMPKPPIAAAPTPVFDGMVNMVWDLMSNITAVRNEARRYVPVGLNVISPTFFEFCPSLDGTVLSIADQGYVDWAHSNGWQVWALIADKLDGHFRSDVARHVFTNTGHRERAIDQVVEFTERYSLDGICINFEAIRAEYADYYIRFLRELAPLLRERGVIVSVTMFVPWSHNLHYNRGQAAKAADFIIIMGYDEHYATSAVAGPNASISFVQNGINRTLQEIQNGVTLWEVPHHQIILGIPLYVRVWRETEVAGRGTPVVSQAAMGMDAAYDLFISHGAQFEWCEVTLSYYAEFRGVDAYGQTYRRRVWLEEERSIAAKLDLVIYHNLAGTAGWRKGLERPAIWDVLNEYLQ